MISNIKKLVLGSALMVSATYFSQEVAITQQQLPAQINKFVQTNFPGKTLSSITQEKKTGKTEYEIHLDNGIKLEFNNTAINEIESNERLPDAVVPKPILAYVTKNYPQNFIREWKLSDNKHKVELDSGLELEFNKKGQFLRID